MERLDPIISGAQAFWAALVDVWDNGVLGSSVGALVIAAAAMLAGLLLRGLVASTVIAVLERLTKRTAFRFDDEVIEALGSPLRLAPVLLGAYVAVAALALDDGAGALVDKLLGSAVAVLVFWTLVRLVEPVFSDASILRRALTATIADWARNALKALIAFIGAAAVLEKWGIQVGPILAGLGIFGAAVALGAQDLFKNLLGGLAVLIEKRFADGDWILVDGVVEGTVEKIGFRSTHVRRFDKSPVYVPNAKLSDNPVTNFSRMTHRRIKWVIGVEYGTTAAQLEEIRDKIHAYIADNPDFAQSPEVTWFIRVDAFNASSIDYLLYCFTKTTNWVEWLEIKERLALTIKAIVEDAGTGFAFPSRTIYVAAGEDAEAFPSPSAPEGS